MNTNLTLQEERSQRRQYLFKIGDFAWLLFVGILIVTAPESNYDAVILLPLIGVFQIVEPRLKLFSSRRGQIISLALKLILCYLLVGFSHGADSYYTSIFLIPVVSAATTFDLLGVVVVTLIACAAYFSFLLPVFFDPNNTPPDLISFVSVRASFYAIVAFLVYEQARAKRDEMARTQDAADRLTESNRNLRVAQASLRRSERLAALGQLTAGLAHELRNPLGTIKASGEILTRNATAGRPELMAEMSGYIVTEVDRMNGLISNFLDFAKPLQIHPVMTDFAPLVDEVFRQQAELAKIRGVTLTKNISDDPLAFAFDPDLLRLTLSNLVQNAVQASPPGKDVTVRANKNEDFVRVLIADHGEGIQPQHLENIFNPFFTTKPQGVGLGLAIVSKVVSEHQGRINVFSEPGMGTTFEILLPQEQPV